MQFEADYISLTIYKQRQIELMKEAEQQRLIKLSLDAGKKKAQAATDLKGQTR